MKNYWNNLNDREQWLVSIAGFILAAYLIYLLIFSPLISAVQNKSTRLIEQKETLAWMQQIRKQAQNKTTQQSLSSSKLLTLLDNKSNQNALFQQFPYQLQQTGNGDIQLSFEEVPFNLFLSWLSELNKNYFITIKQLSAEHTDKSGIVKLSIVISV